MHLLWFNLATDADDPILGFTSQWIRAVADRVDRIRVITMRAGRVALPENVECVSVGKEAGYGRPRRIVNFYRSLHRILERDRVDACFSHMIPLFSFLSAPLLRRRKIPIATWYAHPSLTTELKLAHYASDAMVTSLPSTYPYRLDKLCIIGQGIDTRTFAPDGSRPDDPPMVLCAGRLSPVKDHATLLRSVARLRRELAGEFRVVILGSPARPYDVEYRASLQRLARDLGVDDIVEFHDGVPLDELPSWYRRCAVHVNLTRAGFGDKVALEAMACARPAVAANEDFRETLECCADRLLFEYGDDVDLCSKLHALLTLAEEERDRTGLYLRDRVQRLHDIRGLADRLVEILESLAKDRRRDSL